MESLILTAFVGGPSAARVVIPIPRKSKTTKLMDRDIRVLLIAMQRRDSGNFSLDAESPERILSAEIGICFRDTHGFPRREPEITQVLVITPRGNRLLGFADDRVLALYRTDILSLSEIFARRESAQGRSES